MLIKNTEQNPGIFLYYSSPVIQEPVFEPQQPTYTTYTYTQNTVIYRATATRNGVYCYSYCYNNPLKYTDPSGELFWIIPNIGWSKEGGLSVGITFMFGIPGAASVQTGVGYNFKSNDWYASVGGTFMLNTISASYSQSSGFNVSYSFGFSPETGLPVGSNLFTVGANYNITHNSWSGNVSAWQVDQSGWLFNPSISVSYDISEHVNNLTKGQGFRTNRAVFDRMMSGSDYTCDEIIDYFGFSGSYKPDLNVPGPAGADPVTGDIGYKDAAFEQNYDAFLTASLHEEYHRNEILSGKIDKTDLQWFEKGEYRANLYTYRNQWRYLQAEYYTFKNNVNAYAIQVGRNPGFHWWDFMYKIPRRF